MRHATLTTTGFLPALLCVLAACGDDGISENAFVVDWEEQFCERYVACASEEMLRTVDARECHIHLRNTPYPEPPECSFDGVAARECLAALRGDTDTGEADAEPVCNDVDPVLPGICNEVYSLCPFPRVPPVQFVPPGED